MHLRGFWVHCLLAPALTAATAAAGLSAFVSLLSLPLMLPTGPLPAGDVSVLSGLKERLAAGRHSLSKRMFKRHAKGVSPSKDALKTTVHVSDEFGNVDLHGWMVVVVVCVEGGGGLDRSGECGCAGGGLAELAVSQLHLHSRSLGAD